jgi:hypothetical protein
MTAATRNTAATGRLQGGGAVRAPPGPRGPERLQEAPVSNSALQNERGFRPLQKPVEVCSVLHGACACMNRGCCVHRDNRQRWS